MIHFGPKAMLIRLFSMLLVAATAVSCAGTRRAVPAAPGLPAIFSATGTATAPEAWWTALNDPDLDALVQHGLTNNFSLRAAWDRLMQAEAVAARQGAALVPSVNAEASAGRTRRETGSPSSTTYENEYGAALVASYELDVWGRVRALRDAAAIEAAATEFEVRTAAVSLSAEIALTWYSLVEQRAQAAVLRDQIATSEKGLDVLRSRFRSGRGGAVDVLQQEQLVETRRGDAETVAARIRVLENRLAVLIGEVPGTAVPPRDTLPELPAVPATGVPLEVLHRRPDVARSLARVEAADRRVAAAVADRLPRLGLSAGLSSSAPEVDDVFSDWLASIAANLAGPVIDGGARRAEVARTEAARSEAINTYRQAMLEAFGETEDALVQEQRQRALLDSIDRQAALARQITQGLRDRFLGGNEDFLRILTAEVNRQSLDRQRLTARRQLIDYRIGLYRALAGGFPLERPAPATLNEE
mgnify:CR=1 FL=1